MTTFPRGRRPKVGLDSFVEMTAVSVSSIKDGVVTFDGDLTEPEAAAVSAWLDSTSDEDKAARADLRAKRDAVIGDDPVSVAVRAAINYQLGDAIEETP